MKRALAVVAALAAAGTSAAAPAAPRAGGSIATTPVAVYLIRGERVAPVRRFVTAESGVARATLATLLRGATAAERRSGYSSAVPAGTGNDKKVLPSVPPTYWVSR